MSRKTDWRESFYNKIYKEVSEETGIPVEKVREAYVGYWKAIKASIEQLDIKRSIPWSEFSKMTKSWNIPRIGKLYISYRNYKIKRRSFKIAETYLKNHKDDNIKEE